MSNPTDSYRNPSRYLGQDYRFVPTYIRPRDPLSPTSASTDIKPKEQQGYYPVTSLWTNSSNGNIWALAKITNNLANWILISSGGTGPILQVDVDANTAPGTDPVLPNGTGVMTVTGKQVASGQAGTEGVQTHSTAANQYQIRVQQASTAASLDTTKNGLSHFSSDHFTSSSGFIDSKAATAQAASSFSNAGIASFNNTQFSVDANGFVQLAGGGLAIDSIQVDANTAPGTNPVAPTGAGLVTVTGGQVAAGTIGANVIRTDSLAANTYTIEIQRSTTASSPTSASNGVSHFNSLNFSVDSNGFVTAKNGVQPGVSNLGISYNAGTGTFTVTGSNGTALSATNPAYITLQSKTAGRLVTVSLTADQSFIDDNGASQIIGNTFGLTSGVAFASDIPFFLYAVLDDTESSIAFMISRYPNTAVSPVAAKIGKSGSAVASTAGSFFSLANVTVADYESNPCLSIGSFRMRMSNLDDWTVQTLSNKDGIGEFQQGVQFGSVTGQFGNATGSFFKSNGGTAPIWDQQAWVYYLTRDNRCNFNGAFTNNTTPGAGAVTALQGVPFTIVDGGATGSGWLTVGGNYSFVGLDPVAPGATQYQFPFVNPATSGVYTLAGVLNLECAIQGSFTIEFT